LRGEEIFAGARVLCALKWLKFNDTSGSIEEPLSTSGAEKSDTSTKSDESTLMSHDGGIIIEWGPQDAELYNVRWPLQDSEEKVSAQSETEK
jgi:hypothetical protein